jgi:Mn2+/Fe2+ NRAMP family transporter
MTGTSGNPPTTDAAPFDHLEAPALSVRSLLRHFGPGLILMMTGIGTSHLVTAPTAGGRFEYALLWCIPVAYVFKYYGFEMAFRFTHATGKSLIEAYGTAWKRWPLWYVLVTTLVQCAIGQAGRLIAASAVVYFLVSSTLHVEIPLAAYAFVLAVISVVIILRGSYRAVELAAKVTAGILVVSTIAVYVVHPAPVSALAHMFRLETPAGSWLIIAAFLGLLPTGIDVSLQASEWGKAQRVGLGRIRDQLESMGYVSSFDPFGSPRSHLTVDTRRLPPRAREYCVRWLRIGLWDFRVGHVVSFVTACMFLLLAAVWLHPSPVEGQAVMGEIARIFTESVGAWMMLVFLVGAFAATYSTAFNYFDGWPRIVAACCRNLFVPTANLRGTAHDELTDRHRRVWFSEYNLYRITMAYSLIAAVAIVAGVPRPVFLVLIASALAFFIAPVIFYLNLHYCLTLIPKDDDVFYPSRFARWFGWMSLIVFTGLSAILILAQVFKVPLFGA